MKIFAALFAAGLAVFAFPVQEAVAQNVSEGCPEGQLEIEAEGSDFSFCEVPLLASACDGITGAELDAINNICACADSNEEIFGNACAAPNECVGGILTGDNVCECSAGFTLSGTTCAADAGATIEEYSAADCTAQGWETSNNDSVCDIPLQGQGLVAIARQFSPTARGMGCVLGADASADNRLPNCGAPDVFGSNGIHNGIPKKPDDFNPARDRIVLSCSAGQDVDQNDARLCIQARGVGGSASSGGSGGKTDGAQRFALGAGIIILAGAAFGVWEETGNLSAFSLTPTADYAYENGAWRARQGTRLDYRGDDWALWWSAEGIRGANDAATESRFGWGGEWRGEILRLDVAALISDGVADLRAGAGAEWDFQGWALRPSWRVRAEALNSGEWDGRMDADIAAEWGRLGWNIRPSFGATGSLQNAETNEAFMRLRVERTLGW